MIEETGPRASRNRLQTTTLLDAIEAHGFDAAFGGARRDEERARAKERIFSFRDDFGQLGSQAPAPRALVAVQRARSRRGEHVRVFPLSNWTELDVWQYIDERGPRDPDHLLRPRARRSSIATACCSRRPTSCEPLRRRGASSTTIVRYRTVGDMTCTGAVESTAPTIGEVVAEIAATRITERGETRADDRVSEAAMEDRKVAGYF